MLYSISNCFFVVLHDIPVKIRNFRNFPVLITSNIFTQTGGHIYVVYVSSFLPPELLILLTQPTKPWTTKFSENWINFFLRKCIWKCHLQNGSHFIVISVCLDFHITSYLSMTSNQILQTNVSTLHQGSQVHYKKKENIYSLTLYMLNFSEGT